MECIYTIGTSSASHTYGNVASAVKEILLRYFTPNFFSYVYIDSKIAWKNIAEILGNDDTEFKKRHYPFMIITPRFVSDDDNIFLSNTPLVTNIDNAVAGLTRNTLFPMITDKANGMELAYRINRDRADFEVELRLRSLNQQIDIFKNLKNQMLWNRPFLAPTALESMIPKSMIEYIGKLAGIDITQAPKTITDQVDESTNQVPLIMRYLNAHSRMPITYKIRNSTSVEEFFLYYKTKLLLTFTDLALGDASKRNAVDEYYSLTFRVSAEFSLPGLFALIGSHEKKFHGLRFDMVVQNPSGDISDLIPMYTYTNLYDRYDVDTMDGFTFYSSTIVQCEEENAHKDEIVELEDIIPADHMAILNQFIRDGIPPETIFRIRLLKNSKDLGTNCETIETSPREWDIDWDRKRIIIHDSDPLITYRIIVYANMIQLNERFAVLQDRVKTDQTNLQQNTSWG